MDMNQKASRMLRRQLLNFEKGWVFLMIIGQISAVSYNQPVFCPNATWNLSATTFASSSTLGGDPFDIYIAADNTVYVIGQGNDCFLSWPRGNTTSIRTVPSPPSYPYSLFVTTAGDLYVSSASTDLLTYQWTPNATASVPIMSTCDACAGLFVDTGNNLYCSMTDSNQVVTRSLDRQPNTYTITAGTGIAGNSSDMLNGPFGIFVSVGGDLYVADCNNNRVQLFRSGAVNATTVAGNGTVENIALNCPIGVMVDGGGYLFIVDNGNNRIIGSGPGGFRCVAGCSGRGSSSYQLKNPLSMAFDSFGNIFVADEKNGRVQMFQLATNSCNQTTPMTTTAMTNVQTPVSAVNTTTASMRTGVRNGSTGSSAPIVSYNQPVFCPNATWNQSATTFASHNTLGGDPYDIFITTDNTVYVASQTYYGIMIWSRGSILQGTYIYGSWSYPYSLFVTIAGDLYVSSGSSTPRVDQWTLNTSSSVPMMNICDVCNDIFVDTDNNLYCSMTDSNQVVTKSLDRQPNTFTITAGTGIVGNDSDTLSGPAGIFVNMAGDLYVADCGNNRVQLFRSGAVNATTVAGYGAVGTIALNCPTGVMLDGGGYLFIVDSWNNRILGSGPAGFRCVAGCYGQAYSYQLSNPLSMAFDSFGNLFVADEYNNGRIQMFQLATNSCGVSTSTLTSRSTPTSTARSTLTSTLTPTSSSTSTPTSISISTSTPTSTSTSTFTSTSASTSTSRSVLTSLFNSQLSSTTALDAAITSNVPVPHQGSTNSRNTTNTPLSVLPSFINTQSASTQNQIAQIKTTESTTAEATMFESTSPTAATSTMMEESDKGAESTTEEGILTSETWGIAAGVALSTNSTKVESTSVTMFGSQAVGAVKVEPSSTSETPSGLTTIMEELITTAKLESELSTSVITSSVFPATLDNGSALTLTAASSSQPMSIFSSTLKAAEKTDKDSVTALTETETEYFEPTEPYHSASNEASTKTSTQEERITPSLSTAEGVEIHAVSSTTLDRSTVQTPLTSEGISVDPSLIENTTVSSTNTTVSSTPLSSIEEDESDGLLTDVISGSSSSTTQANGGASLHTDTYALSSTSIDHITMTTVNVEEERSSTAQTSISSTNPNEITVRTSLNNDEDDGAMCSMKVANTSLASSIDEGSGDESSSAEITAAIVELILQQPLSTMQQDDGVSLSTDMFAVQSTPIDHITVQSSMTTSNVETDSSSRMQTIVSSPEEESITGYDDEELLSIQMTTIISTTTNRITTQTFETIQEDHSEPSSIGDAAVPLTTMVVNTSIGSTNEEEISGESSAATGTSPFSLTTGESEEQASFARMTVETSVIPEPITKEPSSTAAEIEEPSSSSIRTAPSTTVEEVTTRTSSETEVDQPDQTPTAVAIVPTELATITIEQSLSTEGQNEMHTEPSSRLYDTTTQTSTIVEEDQEASSSTAQSSVRSTTAEETTIPTSSNTEEDQRDSTSTEIAAASSQLAEYTTSQLLSTTGEDEIHAVSSITPNSTMESMPTTSEEDSGDPSSMGHTAVSFTTTTLFSTPSAKSTSSLTTEESAEELSSTTQETMEAFSAPNVYVVSSATIDQSTLPTSTTSDNAEEHSSKGQSTPSSTAPDYITTRTSAVTEDDPGAVLISTQTPAITGSHDEEVLTTKSSETTEEYYVAVSSMEHGAVSSTTTMVSGWPGSTADISSPSLSTTAESEQEILTATVTVSISAMIEQITKQPASTAEGNMEVSFSSEIQEISSTLTDSESDYATTQSVSITEKDQGEPSFAARTDGSSTAMEQLPTLISATTSDGDGQLILNEVATISSTIVDHITVPAFITSEHVEEDSSSSSQTPISLDNVSTQTVSITVEDQGAVSLTAQNSVSSSEIEQTISYHGEEGITTQMSALLSTTAIHITTQTSETTEEYYVEASSMGHGALSSTTTMASGWPGSTAGISSPSLSTTEESAEEMVTATTTVSISAMIEQITKQPWSTVEENIGFSFSSEIQEMPSTLPDHTIEQTSRSTKSVEDSSSSSQTPISSDNVSTQTVSITEEDRGEPSSGAPTPMPSTDTTEITTQITSSTEGDDGGGSSTSQATESSRGTEQTITHSASSTTKETTTLPNTTIGIATKASSIIGGDSEELSSTPMSTLASSAITNIAVQTSVSTEGGHEQSSSTGHTVGSSATTIDLITVQASMTSDNSDGEPSSSKQTATSSTIPDYTTTNVSPITVEDQGTLSLSVQNTVSSPEIYHITTQTSETTEEYYVEASSKGHGALSSTTTMVLASSARDGSLWATEEQSSSTKKEDEETSFSSDINAVPSTITDRVTVQTSVTTEPVTEDSSSRASSPIPSTDTTEITTQITSSTEGDDGGGSSTGHTTESSGGTEQIITPSASSTTNETTTLPNTTTGIATKASSIIGGDSEELSSAPMTTMPSTAIEYTSVQTSVSTVVAHPQSSLAGNVIVTPATTIVQNAGAVSSIGMTTAALAVGEQTTTSPSSPTTETSVEVKEGTTPNTSTAEILSTFTTREIGLNSTVSPGSLSHSESTTADQSTVADINVTSEGSLDTATIGPFTLASFLSPLFMPSCRLPGMVGVFCNLTMDACEISKPCQNNASCTSSNVSGRNYDCRCLQGFDGLDCENDHRPCQVDTCWNNGSCNTTSNTTFQCLCQEGWTGDHCEQLVNLCGNVTCSSNGICRPSFRNYACECFGESFSGRHCENVQKGLVVRQAISKSFGYIAIIFLSTVAMFFITMDVLKYCFGIDLTKKEAEMIRQRKLLERKRPKHRPAAVRFIYVHAPPTDTSEV